MVGGLPVGPPPLCLISLGLDDLWRRRTARTRTALLVQVPGTLTHRAAVHAPAGHAGPDIIIFRLDAPLSFASGCPSRRHLGADCTADPPTQRAVIE